MDGTEDAQVFNERYYLNMTGEERDAEIVKLMETKEWIILKGQLTVNTKPGLPWDERPPGEYDTGLIFRSFSYRLRNRITVFLRELFSQHPRRDRAVQKTPHAGQHRSGRSLAGPVIAIAGKTGNKT